MNADTNSTNTGNRGNRAYRTAVVGPVTGRSFLAFTTGERWNGAPVLAFQLPILLDLIRSGNGADANGEGLCLRAGMPIDVTGANADPVPAILTELDSGPVLLFVPAGRVWEIDSDSVTSIRGNSGNRHGVDDRCRRCGEDLAAPHAPACSTRA